MWKHILSIFWNLKALVILRYDVKPHGRWFTHYPSHCCPVGSPVFSFLTMLLALNATLHFKTQKVGTSFINHVSTWRHKTAKFQTILRTKSTSWRLDQPASLKISTTMTVEKRPGICGCVSQDAPFNPRLFVVQRLEDYLLQPWLACRFFLHSSEKSFNF